MLAQRLISSFPPLSPLGNGVTMVTGTDCARDSLKVDQARIPQDYPVVLCSQPEEVERALVSGSDRCGLWSWPSHPLA